MADKTLKDLLNSLKRIERDIKSGKAMFRVGRIVKNIIFRRTKTGIGVDEPGDNAGPKRLHPLSDSYKEQRSGKLKFFTIDVAGTKRVIAVKGDGNSIVTGKFGTPGKSNLTLTGQLLDSIEIKASFGKVNIFIPNTKRVKRNRKEKTRTNKEILEFVEKGGSFTNENGNKVVIPARPFFALTQDEKQILVSDARDRVRQMIRRFLT